MRRLLLIVFASLALIVLLVGAFRSTLAETALRRTLAEAGFPEADFALASFELSEAVVRDVSLGPDLPTIEKISLAYNPLDLLAGEIASMRIERASATDRGVSEALRRAMAGEPSDGALDLPDLTVVDSRIDFDDAGLGEGSITLDGALGDRDGALRADFVAGVEAPWASGEVKATTDDAVGDAPQIALDGALRLDLAALSRVAGVEIVGGVADVAIRGEGVVPAGPVETPAALISALRGDLLVEATIADFDAPGAVAGGEAALDLRLVADADGVRVLATAPTTFAAVAAGPPRGWPARRRDDERVDPMTGPLSGKLEAGGESGVLARAAIEDGRVVASLHPKLDVEIDREAAAQTESQGEDPPAGKAAAAPLRLALSGDVVASGEDLSAIIRSAVASLVVDAAHLPVGPAIISKARWDGAIAGGGSADAPSVGVDGALTIVGDVDAPAVAAGAAAFDGALTGGLDLVGGPSGWSLAGWRVAAAEGSALSVEALTVDGLIATRAPAAFFDRSARGERRRDKGAASGRRRSGAKRMVGVRRRRRASAPRRSRRRRRSDARRPAGGPRQRPRAGRRPHRRSAGLGRPARRRRCGRPHRHRRRGAGRLGRGTFDRHAPSGALRGHAP